jgi:hypothetical protein
VPVRIVLIAALALIIAACVSSEDAGKPFPSEARRTLVINWTTTREVQMLLGPPMSIKTATENRETWVYEHTRISARRLLPFGGNITVRQTPHEQLALTFQDGMLSDCTYIVQEYRTEGTVTVPTRALREPCGIGAGAGIDAPDPGAIPWTSVSEGRSTPGAPITAVVTGLDRVALFVADPNGGVYTTSGSAGAGWGPWTSVSQGRSTPGAPITAVVTGPDRVAVFLADPNGGVYTTTKIQHS